MSNDRSRYDKTSIQALSTTYNTMLRGVGQVNPWLHPCEAEVSGYKCHHQWPPECEGQRKAISTAHNILKDDNMCWPMRLRCQCARWRKLSSLFCLETDVIRRFSLLRVLVPTPIADADIAPINLTRNVWLTGRWGGTGTGKLTNCLTCWLPGLI